MIGRRDPRYGAYLPKRRIPSCRSCSTLIAKGWALRHDGVAARRRWCVVCYLAGVAQRKSDKGATAAHMAVWSAVKAGSMPPARTLKCVDCGAQARDYDHRDYSKPLDVQPVCRRCNILRGPARRWLPEELSA